MTPDYGPSTFGGDFYHQRMGLRNHDEQDNSRRETTNGNYLLKVLARAVTLGSTAGMGERDIHAGAMRNHGKAIDLLGPKAVAGREDATARVLINSTTAAQEPIVLQHMNDRLACHQEITIGVIEREDNEIELINLLRERGLTNEDRYTDE